MVGKATFSRRGPRDPRWSFGEQVVIRCSKESHHSAESWAPGPPVEQPWRTRKTTLTAIRVGGVNILQFCSVSSSLSHANVTNKLRGTYFSKEVFARPLSLCRCDSFCMNLHMTIQQDEWLLRASADLCIYHTFH